jgi:triosephosphate isomerase
MHTDRSSAVALAASVAEGARGVELGDVVVGVAPPFPFLEAVGAALAGSPVELVAQDVHPEPKGAFTSAVSAPMLASLGVARVIVGHSERRAHFGDDDATVARKLRAALAEGLGPILCVGERLEQRESGDHQPVVRAQVEAALKGLDAEGLAKVVVAYEPVWAIGTGKTATPEQAGEMHRFLRGVVQELGGELPILYGGSVKPANADALAATPGIDGVLVGGASLAADSFVPIISSCANALREQG